MTDRARQGLRPDRGRGALVSGLDGARLLPRRRAAPQAAVLHRHPAAERHRLAAHGPRAHRAPSRTSSSAGSACSGYNALWLPGTDHAGIATQMVVERELKQTERQDRATTSAARSSSSASGQWKEKYGGRIVEQLQGARAARSTGSRERFTMDERLSRAVREAFVRLYEEGLIYRARAPHQLVPALPHRALRPRGRARGASARRAVAHSPTRSRAARARARGRHHAARDDARRHRGGRAPRRPALPAPRSASSVTLPLARPRDPDHRRRRARRSRSSAPAR